MLEIFGAKSLWNANTNRFSMSLRYTFFEVNILKKTAVFLKKLDPRGRTTFNTSRIKDLGELAGGIKVLGNPKLC